jgi:hypothetical protein
MANSHYGEPTWGSKVLIMTFSVAVAFMAGWLALALMLRQSDPPGPVADREIPAMPTKQPPRVAAAAAITRPLVAASQLLSPKADPVAATGTIPPPPPANPSPGPAQVAAPAPAAAPAAAAAPAQAPAAASPMTLASLPPVLVAPPETIPAAQPGAASVPAGDIYGQVTNKITEDDPVDPPEVVPLPPRRPHFAAVPIPRPRPQIPEEQARAEPQTLVDFLTNGWR